MLNIKIELRKKFQPSGISSTNSGTSLQVSQGNMVSQNSKFYTDQKVSPPLKTLPNCNILPVCCRVIPFGRWQPFAVEFYRMPPTWNCLLLKNTPYTVIGSITNNPSWRRIIKNFQNRCTTQQLLQQIKRILLSLTPNKLLILPSQQSQWPRHLGKPQNKTTVIVAKTQKLLNMSNILWHRPFLNNINLSWL